MFNLSKIMCRAWANFHKYNISFSEALHRAWLTAKSEKENAKRIAEAKSAAGVTEDAKTWAGWRDAGYEVVHGSKALFVAELIWGSRGDNVIYRASFFGESQVRAIA